MAANGRKTRANHVGRLENSTLLPGGIMFYNPPDSYTPSRSQLFRNHVDRITLIRVFTNLRHEMLMKEKNINANSSGRAFIDQLKYPTYQGIGRDINMY